MPTPGLDRAHVDLKLNFTGGHREHTVLIFWHVMVLVEKVSKTKQRLHAYVSTRKVGQSTDLYSVEMKAAGPNHAERQIKMCSARKHGDYLFFPIKMLIDIPVTVLRHKLSSMDSFTQRQVMLNETQDTFSACARLSCFNHPANRLLAPSGPRFRKQNLASLL